MNSETPLASLRDAGVKLIDCVHKTPAAADHGFPYIAIPQLSEGRVDVDSARRISEQDMLEWNVKCNPQEDDIVLSRRCNPGVTAVIPKGFRGSLGQNLVLLRATDTNLLTPKYLRWVTRGREWWNEVDRYINVGAVFESLRCADIPEFAIPVPSIPEQRAIAHILGTLDEKIELNRKTNETLEAMAKALFKSWFVDFEPLRAKAEGRSTGLPAEISDLFPDSFEDSELGEIPSGWRVAELGDISTISGGKQLESVELKRKGRFPVYGANGTMGFHDLATHNSFVIVFGRVGAYCGSINWEYGGAWVNNNASSVIPLRYNELVLQWMLEADYSNYRTGSAQPFIPNGALACSPVLMPTDALASVFCDLLLPIRLKQKKNQSAALSLVEIRDALLPKLISGEIRIPDAEKMLEEVGV